MTLVEYQYACGTSECGSRIALATETTRPHYLWLGSLLSVTKTFHTCKWPHRENESRACQLFNVCPLYIKHAGEFLNVKIEVHEVEVENRGALFLTTEERNVSCYMLCGE